MALLRSLLHLLWMGITVVPYTLAILLCRVLGAPKTVLYRIARAWLALSIRAAHWFMGIRPRIQGMENLPTDQRQGVVLLCKHQSAYARAFRAWKICPRTSARAWCCCASTSRHTKPF